MAEGFGDCYMARIGDTLEVTRADPRILITQQALDEVRNGDRRYVTLIGDILTINASNRRVIYRIGEYLPNRQAYVAEWPD